MCVHINYALHVTPTDRRAGGTVGAQSGRQLFAHLEPVGRVQRAVEEEQVGGHADQDQVADDVVREQHVPVVAGMRALTGWRRAVSGARMCERARDGTIRYHFAFAARAVSPNPPDARYLHHQRINPSRRHQTERIRARDYQQKGEHKTARNNRRRPAGDACVLAQ